MSGKGMPLALKQRLVQAAVAIMLLGPTAYGINEASKPSAAVVLAMEIGAHYESSGRHIGTPYVDKAGKGQPLTVCNGVTGTGVVAGRYYSPEDCKRLELPIYLEAERAAKRLFMHWHTYNVWVQASLLDMLYNLGEKQISTSTLRQKGNAGDLLGMCMEMPKWVRGTIDGKSVVLNGLIDRRGATTEICLDWGRDGHITAGLLGPVTP